MKDDEKFMTYISRNNKLFDDVEAIDVVLSDQEMAM